MGSGPVVLASDHGGFPLKEALKRHLAGRGIEVRDVGTHSADACDYPVFARAAAEMVASGQAWRGIVVDGAGIGSCMVANKVAGVRAGMAFDTATAKNAREHNDANLLTLGAGTLGEEAARSIVDIFLSTACTVDRHRRRVAMIDALDAPARKPLPMASSHSDHERLVEQIIKVLSSNPGLLAPLAAAGQHGASACANCNHCGHCVSKQTDTVRAIAAHAPGARLSAGLGVTDVPREMAAFIDHTLLKPEATYAEVDKLCDEARQHGFASVCVNPMHVKRCAARLKGAKPVVCTVIGFPLGATPREVKALEARRAIRDGAREIDMVIAVGALKSGDHSYVYEDIRIVAEAARDGSALCKVIIETALLTDEEKVAACVLSKRAQADFVKTSTGFAKGGATAHDVSLMAKAVDYQLGVKASGGIRSAADAEQMILAGATRIGASVGVKIVGESRGKGGSTDARPRSGGAGGGY
jgi:deoxyribose-phosphate aldolase